MAMRVVGAGGSRMGCCSPRGVLMGGRSGSPTPTPHRSPLPPPRCAGGGHPGSPPPARQPQVGGGGGAMSGQWSLFAVGALPPLPPSLGVRPPPFHARLGGAQEDGWGRGGNAGSGGGWTEEWGGGVNGAALGGLQGGGRWVMGGDPSILPPSPHAMGGGCPAPPIPSFTNSAGSLHPPAGASSPPRCTGRG